MRYLPIFIVIIFCYSCKLPKFHHVEAEKPYITLKNGTVINAENVQLQSSKKGVSKIIADNNTYAPKTVASYSDGISTFGNIHDSQFAKKVVAGKINLFSNNINSYGKPASSKPFYYFVQKTDYSNELRRMSYTSLRNLIPPNSSASKYLSRYRNLHFGSLVLGSISLCGSAIGLYQIIQNKSGHPGLLPGVDGVVLTATCVWSFLTFAIINEENKVNLFRAVKRYDSE